jgi:leucyl-tRNA synthetase
MMFTSPPEQTLEWSDAGVEGSYRFLRRLWAFVADRAGTLAATSAAIAPAGAHRFPDGIATSAPAVAALRREIHAVLKQATFDMERKQFNTVASAAMKMLNALQAAELQVSGGATSLGSLALHESVAILLRVIYPITPHLSDVLWSTFGFGPSILDAPWPAVDEAALAQDEIELVLQVNGKLRGSMRVPKDAARADIEALALANESVRRFTEGQVPKKVIVVPGRLVNVVV